MHMPMKSTILIISYKTELLLPSKFSLTTTDITMVLLCILHETDLKTNPLLL